MNLTSHGLGILNKLKCPLLSFKLITMTVFWSPYLDKQILRTCFTWRFRLCGAWRSIHERSYDSCPTYAGHTTSIPHHLLFTKNGARNCVNMSVNLRHTYLCRTTVIAGLAHNSVDQCYMHHGIISSTHEQRTRSGYRMAIRRSTEKPRTSRGSSVAAHMAR